MMFSVLAEMHKPVQFLYVLCPVSDQQADWADVSSVSNLPGASSSVHWRVNTSSVTREELPWENVQDAIWRAECMLQLAFVCVVHVNVGECQTIQRRVMSFWVPWNGKAFLDEPREHKFFQSGCVLTDTVIVFVCLSCHFSSSPPSPPPAKGL